MAAYMVHRVGKSLILNKTENILRLARCNLQPVRHRSIFITKPQVILNRRIPIIFSFQPIQLSGYRFESTGIKNTSTDGLEWITVNSNAQSSTNFIPESGIQKGAVLNDTSVTENGSSNLASELPPGYIPEPPTITSANLPTEYIPEPPSAFEVLQNAVTSEPSFLSQGLGGWSPIGLIQSCLEYMHVTVGLPWWGSIAIAALVMRSVMFPLVIMSQRYAGHMNNHLPQMQIIQAKITEARNSGNTMEAARYTQELLQFMKEKKINPLKNMIVPLIQAPVFISFFISLRRMANLPVESMKIGGLFWFENLTVPDPFYALPIITCATLLAVIEVGAESGMRADSMQTMRYVFRAMPLVMFPFIMNFPTAIVFYWATTNFISLIQVAFLHYPPVRKALKIPVIERHSMEKLPLSNKGFVQGFKDNYTNTKIAREIEDRHRIDEMRFKRAGTGPIIKTYPYDPTKQTAPQHAASKSTSSAVKK